MRRHVTFSALMSCLLIGLCALAVATAGSRSSRPSVLLGAASHPNPVVLPVGLAPALVQSLARDLPAAWQVTRTARGARLANPAQRLVMQLDNTGLHLTDKSGATVSLRLTDYRQGSRRFALNPTTLSIHGARVSLAHGADLTEWYVNSPLGIEQGFTLARPLNKAPSVALTFTLRGVLTPGLKRGALEFQDRDGHAVLRYGELLAFDARHRPLPAQMTLTGERLTLNVDTRGAQYPVTVDPLFSAITPFTEPVPAANDNFGYRVALSGDGQTVLIGTPGAASSAGAAYVYIATNGVWSTIPVASFNDPAATAGDGFGTSIALAADGSTALIGAPYTAVSGNSTAGVAYVYIATNGVWSATPVASFADPAATADDRFGFSVALSGAGATALIGAYFTTVSGQSKAGKAYVYSASSGAWFTTPAASFADPAATANDYFGSSVALAANGTTALIGASGTAVSGKIVAGTAHVFTQAGGNWSTIPVASFSMPAPQSYDFFGSSVALSANGTTALIGAPGASFSGKAYVYTASGGAWSTTPVASFTDPAAPGVDLFGSNVMLSGTGTTALIGAPHTSVSGSITAGKAYMYSASSGVWFTTPVASLSDPAATASDYFAESVALSADGSTALIGAYGTKVSGNSAAGKAYMFTSQVDLSLAINSNPGTVTVGQNVTYMTTITNNDTQVTATNIMLTDTLPAGMSFVSVSAAGGTCGNSGGSVSCTLPSLAPQATWQPSFTVTVTATTAGSIQNTASVSATQPDSNTANNSATVTTTVAAASPVASNGSVSTPENTAVSGTLQATGNGTLTFVIVSQPTHGTVTLTNPASGAFTYTPADGFSGADSFTFKANNGSADSNTASESITVNAASSVGGGTPAPASGGGGGLDWLSLLVLAPLAAGLRRQVLRHRRFPARRFLRAAW